MLKSPQAKAHLPLPGLNIVCRSVFGGALSAEKLPAAKKEFFEKGKKCAGRREGCSAVEGIFLQGGPDPPPADKVALQNELLRLGGLSDDELKFEFSSRLKAVGVLKRLAQANSLPVSKGAKKGDLIDVITHYARRAMPTSPIVRETPAEGSQGVSERWQRYGAARGEKGPVFIEEIPGLPEVSGLQGRGFCRGLNEEGGYN